MVVYLLSNGLILHIYAQWLEQWPPNSITYPRRRKAVDPSVVQSLATHSSARNPFPLLCTFCHKWICTSRGRPTFGVKCLRSCYSLSPAGLLREPEGLKKFIWLIDWLTRIELQQLLFTYLIKLFILKFLIWYDNCDNRDWLLILIFVCFVRNIVHYLSNLVSFHTPATSCIRRWWDRRVGILVRWPCSARWWWQSSIRLSNQLLYFLKNNKNSDEMH